jgi:AcrR family transcriptional regulator
MATQAERVAPGGPRPAQEDAAIAGLIERYRFPDGYRRVFLAAVAAFAERGFHGTTTREIAARAGMSPAALYVHFQSKEEALHQVAMSALDLTADVVSAAAASADGAAGQLSAVVRALTLWHARHGAVARVVLYQLDALTPAHRDEIAGKQRRVSRAVRQIIADGTRTGEFALPATAGVTTAVLSLCLDVARWYRPGHQRTPDQLADQNARTALRIAAARPGAAPRR